MNPNYLKVAAIADCLKAWLVFHPDADDDGTLKHLINHLDTIANELLSTQFPFNLGGGHE